MHSHCVKTHCKTLTILIAHNSVKIRCVHECYINIQQYNICIRWLLQINLLMFSNVNVSPSYINIKPFKSEPVLKNILHLCNEMIYFCSYTCKKRKYCYLLLFLNNYTYSGVQHKCTNIKRKAYPLWK